MLLEKYWGIGVAEKTEAGPTSKNMASKMRQDLSGLFSYAISQIAPLPPAVALNRSFQITNCSYIRCILAHNSPNHFGLFLLLRYIATFKSRSLQDSNATKSQTLTFYESQRFSAAKDRMLHKVLSAWNFRRKAQLEGKERSTGGDSI